MIEIKKATSTKNIHPPKKRHFDQRKTQKTNTQNKRLCKIANNLQKVAYYLLFLFPCSKKNTCVDRMFFIGTRSFLQV
ncbi:hypothetical protein [Aquimarina hainanensis]|uniref:hypothetical protein n=1 Tax=Aquimarina hainanensis TaxID=1578017 RepID=UPI00361CF4C5